MRLPSKKRTGHPILASDWNLLIDALQARTPRPGPGIELVSSTGGFTYRVRRTAPGGTGESAPPCHFGEIITWDQGGTTKTGIRGGIIHCGDQNWNFDPQEVNKTANGTWLVSLKVEVEVNRDDDGELLLPGVMTGTKPSGDWTKTAWSEGVDYPESEAPEVEDAKGSIVLPIGKLTVKDGSVILEPAGCGSFTIHHCAGTLSYTRA